MPALSLSRTADTDVCPDSTSAVACLFLRQCKRGWQPNRQALRPAMRPTATLPVNAPEGGPRARWVLHPSVCAAGGALAPACRAAAAAGPGRAAGSVPARAVVGVGAPGGAAAKLLGAAAQNFIRCGRSPERSVKRVDR